MWLHVQVPFNVAVPKLLVAFGLVGVCSWANSKCFVTPNSMTPEFLAEQATIGNVVVSKVCSCTSSRMHKTAIYLYAVLTVCTARWHTPLPIVEAASRC